MRTAVIGAGGIGALLGASLANAGEDVTFVARGAHLAAMKANGLRIEGDRGTSVVRPVQATDSPSTIGKVDVRRIEPVDTHRERLPTPVQVIESGNEVLAGCRLFARWHAVLDLEHDHVGR